MTFKVATAYVAVEPNDDGLREKLAARLRAAAEGLRADVGIGLRDGDTTALDAQIRQAAALAGAGSDVEIGIRLEDAIEALREEVHAAAEEASAGQEVRVSMHVEHMDALQELRTGLADVASATDRVGAGVDSLDGLRTGLDNVASASNRTATAIDDLGNRTDSSGRKADNAGSGFLGLSGKVWGLGAAAAEVMPILGALPTIIAAIAAAAGTVALGFGGTIKALHDYGAASTAAGVSGAQQAQTAFSNAVQLRDAQQAIVDAQRNAANQAISSTEQVANAQQSLSDAQRQAARSAQSAADTVVSAEQRAAEAVYSEEQAQKALIQARQDAANQLIDSANATQAAQLQVQKATLDLTDAENNKKLVDANGMSTAEDKQKADLQVQEAQLALAQAKQADAEATQRNNQIQQDGVDQAPSVLDAQHSLAAATQQQADAQHALELATQAQADQQTSSTEQIARAQQSLADAQRSADQQKIASTEQVDKATQSLKDLQKQQALAAAAAAASSAQAANQFATDMNKMVPAARDFTNELLSWRGALHQLQADGQTAMLPGFTTMLQDAKAMLPVVDQAVVGMGRDMGQTAVQFGKLFSDPAFRQQASEFTGLMVNGFGQFLSGLPPLMRSVVDEGVRAAPVVDAIGTGVHNLMVSGLPDFLSGLNVNAGGAAQGIGALFWAVNDLLGPVGTIAGAFSGALGPALADLEPDLKILADDIEKALLPVMPELSQDLTDIADIITQMLPVVTPLISLIGQGLGDALGIVDEPLKLTAGFLKDNAGWLPTVAEGVLGVVAAVKAYNLASSLGAGAVGALKNMTKQFSSEGQIATTATKAWGVATSDTAAKIGKMAAAGGVIALGVAGVSALVDWVNKASTASVNAQDQMSGFTNGLLDISRNAGDTSNKLATMVISAEHIGGDMESQLIAPIDAALEHMVQSGNLQDAQTAIANLDAQIVASGGSADNFNNQLSKYSTAVRSYATDQRLAATNTGATADATKQAAGNAHDASEPFQGLALRLDSVQQAGGHSADELSRLDTNLQSIDKEVSKQQALDDYTKALNGLKDGVAGATREISGNSQSAIDNRQQLEDAVGAARHYYDAQIAAGVGVDQANQNFLAQIDALRGQAEKTYDSKGAVDHLLDSLGLVPSSKSTNIKVDTTDGMKSIKTFQDSVDAVHGTKINLTVEHIYGPGDQEITIAGLGIKANAAGGPVNAGDVSLVGEKGPELVVFNRGGTVIPNEAIRQVGGTTPQSSAASATAAMRPPVTVNYYGTQHPTPEQEAIMKRTLADLVR